MKRAENRHDVLLVHAPHRVRRDGRQVALLRQIHTWLRQVEAKLTCLDGSLIVSLELQQLPQLPVSVRLLCVGLLESIEHLVPHLEKRKQNEM